MGGGGASHGGHCRDHHCGILIISKNNEDDKYISYIWAVYIGVLYVYHTSNIA